MYGHHRRRSSSSSSSSSSSGYHRHHHHPHYAHSGFGYSNYQPSFGADRNRDGLVTEADFVISARERGWGWAGDFSLIFFLLIFNFFT